ncbi:hypothetical protein [Pseudonocardia kunmingensis]|uniref:Uncharacterized protein n=1 Tax=Pseudonocardia kunmingensis TaxID=630975 RepID=A0A543E2U0_9PSEU|nr:hypothetical protein [Pseudonocardia kunmingensis]TQM15925.1 hypothetical protein FB558_2722 [Pseudonocardia kunmingensis]
MEDRTSQGTTHDLLLALAGRVDDDLLTWARELVAVGEDARAVEMLTASLVAARAVLPAPLRAALVAAARVARTDLGPAEALPAPHDEDGTEHRFTAPGDDDPVAAAVRGLPARTLTGCRVLLTRRVTPAGTAPGPLPHPVVLVQLPAAARPPDVLAYQLAAVLERAGTPASVEVLTASGPLSDYHAAALDNAVTLRTDGAGTDAGEEPALPATAGEPAAPQDDAETTAVLPTTPPTPAPVQERHALAPQPDRTPTPWHRDTPAAQEPRRAPSPRPGAEEVAGTQRLDRFTPAEQNGHRPGGGLSGDDRPVPARRAPEPGSPWDGHRIDGAPDEDVLAPVHPVDGDDADHDGPLDDHHEAPRDDHRDEAWHDLRDGSRDDRRGDPTDGSHDDRPAERGGDRHLRGVDGYRDDLPAAFRNGDRRGDESGEDEGGDGEYSDGEYGDEDDLADDIRDDRRDDIRHDRRVEEPPPGAEDEDPAGPPAPHPLAPPRPVPMRDDSRPAPRPAPTTRPRPTVTPISRAPVPPPIPLVRRTGPHPAPRPLPVTEPRPAVHRLDDDRDQAPPADVQDRAPRPPRKPDPQPERRETPAFDSLNDPFNGPLHQPLLAPLLDPTALDDPLGPEPGRPAPAAEAEPAGDDDWSEEWLSGTWAMAPSALDERPDRGVQGPGTTDEDGDARGEPPPRPAPRPAPRHRFTDDQDALEDDLDEDVPSRADDRDRADEDDDRRPDDRHADDEHPDGEGDDRAEPHDRAGTRPAGQRPELGLRPESLARLSDADRQLLARLQAELVEGRKPRIGRRPDLARGAAPRTNGSRRSAPPDLAG